MASPHVADLEQVLGDVTQNEEGFNAAITEFDAKVRAAAQLVDQYMSKKASPMPVDTVKKLEDFKKSVLEFNNACKTFSKKSKEITGTIGEQKKVLSQKIEDVKANPGEDPDVLRQKLDEALTELTSKTQALEALQAEHGDLLKSSAEKLEQETAAWAGRLKAAEDNLQERLDTLDVELCQARSALTITSDELEDTQRQLKEAQKCATEMQKERDDAVVVADDARKNAKFYETKLEVVDKSRANEFKAYEQSVQAHEKDLLEWERRCNDLRRQLEAAKGEREAMRSRLADEHLREHIRALQHENNQLREEKIAQLHTRAEANVFAAAESPLKAQLSASEKDVDFLRNELTQVRDRLFERERETFELAQQLELESARSRGRIDELEKKLFMAEIGGERSRASDGFPADVVSPPSRNVGTQCEDKEKKEIEKELLVTRGRLREVEEDLDVLQAKCDEQRNYFEEKLLHQVKDYELQLAETRSHIKVLSYKNSKLVAELQHAENHLQSPAMALESIETEEKLEAWRRSVEKRAVSAEMQVTALETRVASLRRDLEQQRDFYEGKLTKLNEEFSASISRNQTPRSPTVGGGTGGDHQPKLSLESEEPTTRLGYRSASVVSALNRDPLEVPLRSPAFMDKLQHIDDSLLRIHSECVALDEKEARISQQKDASLKKITDRQQYLRGAEIFWQREGRDQQGPNGETPEEMLAETVREMEELAKQRAQVERGSVLFFKELTEARLRLQQSSVTLIKQRAALYQGEKGSS